MDGEKNLWLEMMKEIDWIFENYASQIPFGNSHIQNMLNIVSEEKSPARRLRAYLLRLWDRKRAMDEALFNLKKTEIKLRKLTLQLEKEQDEMEKELIELQIEKAF